MDLHAADLNGESGTGLSHPPNGRVEPLTGVVRDPTRDLETTPDPPAENAALEGLSYLFSTPEIRRLSMVPSPVERNPFRWGWRRLRGQTEGNAHRKANQEQTQRAPWRRVARWRRVVLLILVAVQTLAASWSLTHTFPYPWLRGSEIAIVAMFAILFAWISFGFWTATAGFWTLWWRVKEFTIFQPGSRPEEPPLRSRTAVLIPICDEDVARVFAGLEASYRSLAATPELSRFDFYVLSDTRDPEKQVEEKVAWAECCRRVGGAGHIFYRHRRARIRRKSGNIADFLRRWGQNYDYMIVFDADSVMNGETMVRLARIMETHPQAGIVQTVPTLVNCDSFFGRVQQFASRAYGPMLAAGLRFWQLGESYYWGHNAILRVAPFIKSCGLARLPGEPPLGGEILSHDFVEAALMGRAGWEVWIAQELGGSYEESPPTMADELKRDRRWCQGNLQHLRLLFGDGIRGGHRAIFSMGVMAYLSALLWFAFVLLNTVYILAQSWLSPTYFSAEPSLFPIWPQWRPQWAIGLLSTTAVLLFLPKFLALLLIMRNRQTRLFGGLTALSASMAAEILVSTCFAPIRMWFHSKFVVLTLMGKQIQWHPQYRTDNETGWKQALRLHGFSTLLAFAWIAGVSWRNAAAAVWLLPVAMTLLLSIPLSVYSSRVRLGRAAKRWRLFLIPEELAPPPVIQDLQHALGDKQQKKVKGETVARPASDACARI